LELRIGSGSPLVEGFRESGGEIWVFLKER